MAQHSWSERSVPAELVERYEREGWWTDDTLGGKVAEWLAAAPAPRSTSTPAPTSGTARTPTSTTKPAG